MKHAPFIRRGFWAAVTIAAATSAAAQQAPAENPWSRMAKDDLAAMRSILAEKNIYAHLGDAEFAASFAQANAEAQALAPQVKDFGSYAALLKRYMGLLQDPHTRVSFKIAPTAYEWPGFLLRRIGDRYKIVASQTAEAPDGAEVTACDGRPLDETMDARAPLENAIPGLRSSRESMAQQFMVDAGNPYHRRPTACVIDGKPVRLGWTRITADALAVANAAHAPYRDPRIFSRPFGDNGVWVRMGLFSANAEQAAQYHALYKEAANFRNKDVIVLDVRGNGGGSYNWFMGFLRALYGPDYTAHYAQARLKIRYVYMSEPKPASAQSDSDDDVKDPEDPAMEAKRVTVRRMTWPNGKIVYAEPEAPKTLEASKPAPANLVRARVLVLTDARCGSSCVSFVDEMRRFPGVTQIGSDTSVDRWSGTAISFALPSGAGSFLAPSMIRLNRDRRDNEPQRPDIAFDGDMSDTAAIETWIRNEVMKTPPPVRP